MSNTHPLNHRSVALPGLVDVQVAKQVLRDVTVLLVGEGLVSKHQVVGWYRRMLGRGKNLDLVVAPILRTVEQLDLFSYVYATYISNTLAEWTQAQNGNSTLGFEKFQKTKNGTRMFHVKHAVEIRLHQVLDDRAYGCALMRLTGPASSVEQIKRLVLHRHYHIHNDLLHGHEMTGRPGKKKPCENSDACRMIISCPTEESLFSTLKMRFPHPHERHPELIKAQVKAALGLRQGARW